jgi:hypothetical protein
MSSVTPSLCCAAASGAKASAAATSTRLRITDVRASPQDQRGAVTTTYCTDDPTYCGWYQVPPQLL